MIEVTGKTGPRLTALPPKIHAILAEKARGKEPDDYLLDGCTRVDRADWLSARLKAACHKAGVSPFTSNGLRRAMVRLLRRKNVSNEVRLAMLGHSEDVARDIYDDVEDQEKRAAVRLARVGDRLEASKVIEGPWSQERAQKTGTDGESGS
jgi:hypothetical protein